MKVIVLMSFGLFCAFSIVEIAANLFGLRKLQHVSAPILMPLLGLSFGLASPSLAWPAWPVLAALGFGFIGDLFMLWSNRETFLMLGLGSFMVCLLFWTIALLAPFSSLAGTPAWRCLLALPYVACVIGIYFILRPHLGDMAVPVLAYSVVLCAMGFAAAFRLGRHGSGAFWIPLAGSLLFMASDTVLAFHLFLFKGKSRYGSFVAALLYIPAQFLLTLGLGLERAKSLL